MNVDWKKVAYWGAGSIGVGAVLYWLYQYQQSAAASNAASQAQQSQDENQALAALLEQPLSSGSTSSSGASVSGPTVDTGNNSLQTLINSILNPPASTASTVGTGSIPATDSNPPPVINPIGGPVSAPVGSGANPIGASTQPGYVPVVDEPVNVTISPGILYRLPTATSLPQ